MSSRVLSSFGMAMGKGEGGGSKEDQSPRKLTRLLISSFSYHIVSALTKHIRDLHSAITASTEMRLYHGTAALIPLAARTFPTSLTSSSCSSVLSADTTVARTDPTVTCVSRIREA